MKAFLRQMPSALFCDLPKRGHPNTTAARCSGLAIVLILTAIGFVVGAKVYLLHQTTAEFYQSRFDVAVSIACTGHVNALAGDAEVDTFLNDHSAALQSCAGVDAARSDSWNDFHASSLYLYALAALSWRLFGFNWSSLAALAGLFAAGSAVGAYIFVRCFTSSRVVALGLSLAVLFAPPAFEQIPNLRDYSKAPLILLGLGLIGRAVFSATSFRRALLLAGCVGVLIGLGKGLRPDAIVLAPIALASFVLLSRAEGWRVRTKQVLSMLLALGIGYTVASAPVEIVNGTKVDTVDTNPHALILGFAQLFQDTLGFERGNYALVREYVDDQASALVNLHHSGVGTTSIVHSIDPAYGPASSALLIAMLTTTPHDVLIRVFATANALGAYPLNHLVYGPLLALLLLAGFVLLPRRTLFFCIVAAVIVPILSLQFHSRHVFYGVMFGAAALGLAYTLAALATTALIDRNAVAWPRRRTVFTRSALVATATAASVVLIYGADELAIDRQQRALTALHQVYHDADWTPIEMERSDSELRFPTLKQTAESTVGVMALSFAFPDPASNVGAISDLDWHTEGSATLAPGDDGFRLTSNDKGGYQLLSRAIRIEELSISSNPSPSATLSIRIHGTSDSSGWRIGALSHDQTRWLDTVVLPRDALDLRATLIIPRAEPAVYLVWDFAKARTSSLDLDLLAISNASALQGCAPAPWSIRPLRRYAHQQLRGLPIAMPAAQSATFYYPFAEMPAWTLESVAIGGASPGCATSARVVRALPPHTLPIEFVELDDTFHPTNRLSWRKILADFAAWHRPPRY